MKKNCFRKVKYIVREEPPQLTVIQLVSYAISLAFLVATGLLTLASCSVIDDDTPASDNAAGKASGSAIAFAVTRGDSTALTHTAQTHTAQTRTAETRTALGTLTLDGSGDNEQSLRDKGFGVFACHTGVHPYVSTSTTANLMWNQLVAYNGSTSQWEYSPLVYWPNGEEGLDAYVTFFAYAPHSDRANGCIADMSHAEDVGDPWIVYQLGGSEEADGADGWKQKQTDLLYDFRKDQKRDQNVSTTVDFLFRHAMACAGDTLIVTAGPRLQRLMMNYAASLGSDISLTLKTLTLDYLLTRKGRLVLNSATQPNWQAVESEDAKVHRYLRLSPSHQLATSSSLACSVTDYLVGGQGVFYIPIEVGSDGQRVTATATWQLTNGDEGEVTTTVDLSRISEPSLRNGIRFSLELPEPECTGSALADATVGMIICSHGKAHVATSGELACEGQKVAVVAYVGDGDTGDDTYNHGLAIALEDAGQASWCTQVAEGCLGIQTDALASALSLLNGLSSTGSLTADDAHSHAAAALAAGYRYDGAVDAGTHPDGTSQWFLPSVGQWNLMAKAVTGHDEGLTDSSNTDYQADAFNPIITAAGGTGVHGGSDQLYWTSTESSVSNAWYMSFENGKTSKTGKTVSYYVRPVLAF